MKECFVEFEIKGNTIRVVATLDKGVFKVRAAINGMAAEQPEEIEAYLPYVTPDIRDKLDLILCIDGCTAEGIPFAAPRSGEDNLDALQRLVLAACHSENPEDAADLMRFAVPPRVIERVQAIAAETADRMTATEICESASAIFEKLHASATHASNAIRNKRSLFSSKPFQAIAKDLETIKQRFGGDMAFFALPAVPTHPNERERDGLSTRWDRLAHHAHGIEAAYRQGPGSMPFAWLVHLLKTSVFRSLLSERVIPKAEAIWRERGEKIAELLVDVAELKPAHSNPTAGFRSGGTRASRSRLSQHRHKPAKARPFHAASFKPTESVPLAEIEREAFARFEAKRPKPDMPEALPSPIAKKPKESAEQFAHRERDRQNAAIQFVARRAGEAVADLIEMAIAGAEMSQATFDQAHKALSTLIARYPPMTTPLRKLLARMEENAFVTQDADDEALGFLSEPLEMDETFGSESFIDGIEHLIGSPSFEDGPESLTSEREDALARTA
ncbi:MAG: hypothetical protein VYD57_01125 [Pseudomonadota bacterium]|nr:hypothetical protein [Pseudomonadota bacterium]